VRALITGVGGFAGQHLAAFALARGDRVFGVARGPVQWHVDDLAQNPAFTVIEADLAARDEADRAVTTAAPDHVYHLAAQSSVHDSFANPVQTLHNNIACTVHIFEAVHRAAPGARVLAVSSSEIYGRSSAPIDEGAPLRPENPYAVSKAAQDLLAYQYGVTHGLDVVRVRPFNHIGPGQSDRFVASSFGRQIAEIEAGIRNPSIKVGNLDARRDFTDVRDMVRAYRIALLRGEKGAAYNVGSGRAIAVRDLLDRFIALSRVPVSVQVAEDRLRQSDAPVIVCDCRRFSSRTHWVPSIPLNQTVEDIVTYWRAAVRAA